MNTTLKLQLGCVNSSKLDLFQPEMWTSDQLQKLSPTNFGATLNAISSLVSADGALHSSLQDGQQIDLFGQEAALVNPSQPQAKDLPKQTKDTSGQSSSISSASAALSMSLGSKLQARLAKVGSMEYRQTWNLKTTPAGRSYWAHTALAHRTSDNDSTGWPTPMANKNSPQTRSDFTPNLAAVAQTVIGNELSTLVNVMKMETALSAESTIQNVDALAQRKTTNTNTEKETESLKLAGWCSPTVTDASRGVMPPRPQDTGIPLSQQVAGMTGWATPSSRDWKDSAGQSTSGVNPDGSDRTRMDQLPRQAFGLITDSPSAETVKPDASQLNPHFSRWLMGFPPEWCACAVTAMQSFPKSRRSS
jgi:hypothetical protein